MNLLTLFAPRASLLAVLIVLSASLITLTGCGKKGPVRPKLASLPSAPGDFSLQQRGNFFVLGWELPANSMERSPTEDLAGFRIKRLTYAAEDGCPTCREPQLEVAEISLRYPESAQQVSNRIYWRDFDIKPGNGYRYAVSPITIGNIEGPAAMIHRTVLQPPPAPTDLQVVAGDAEVEVKWQAPSIPDGLQLIGYNLYRRQAKRGFPVVPVNAKPLTATKLRDRGLENGRAYEYRVSTLVLVDGQRLESMAGPAVLITPQQGR